MQRFLDICMATLTVTVTAGAILYGVIPGGGWQ